jgi:hypothetical protein
LLEMTRRGVFAVDLQWISRDKQAIDGHNVNPKFRGAYRVIDRSYSKEGWQTGGAAWPEERASGVRIIPSGAMPSDMTVEWDGLQYFIWGCKKVKVELSSNLAGLLSSLKRFSDTPDVLQNLEQDGWLKISADAIDEIRGTRSPDFHLLQLVRKRRALDEYFSTSFALRHFLFDVFLFSHAAMIEGVRTFLGMDEERDGSGVSLSFYDRRMDWLASRFGISLDAPSDAGFSLARQSIASARGGLRKAYASVADPFWKLMEDHPGLIRTIYNEDEESDTIAQRWGQTFAEVEDCMCDAKNLAASLDATLHYLGACGDRTELQQALEVLSGCNLLHVDGILRLAMSVHVGKAVAGGVTIAFGEFPEVEVPEDLRIDLFRSVSELVLNAIVHADARLITVDARLQGSRLVVSVKDDGCGFVDPAGKTMPESKGGLARISHTVVRRRWESFVASEPNGGTESRLSIDVGGWEQIRSGTMADAPAQPISVSEMGMSAGAASFLGAGDKTPPAEPGSAVAYSFAASATCVSAGYVLISAANVLATPIV